MSQPPEVRQERKLSVLTPLVDVFVENRVLNGVIQAPSHHSTGGLWRMFAYQQIRNSADLFPSSLHLSWVSSSRDGERCDGRQRFIIKSAPNLVLRVLATDICCSQSSLSRKVSPLHIQIFSVFISHNWSPGSVAQSNRNLILTLSWSPILMKKEVIQYPNYTVILQKTDVFKCCIQHSWPSVPGLGIDGEEGEGCVVLAPVILTLWL